MLNKSITGYIDEYNDTIPPWDPAFVEYYKDFIEKDLECLAKWEIKPICNEAFYDYNGITTNCSEGTINYFLMKSEI
jgi:hypothetical protein